MSESASTQDLPALTAEEPASSLRSVTRSIVVTLITEMTQQDKSIAYIAHRLSRTEASVRRIINYMIDGKPVSLDIISDLFLALGCEPVWNVQVNNG